MAPDSQVLNKWPLISLVCKFTDGSWVSFLGSHNGGLPACSAIFVQPEKWGDRTPCATSMWQASFLHPVLTFFMDIPTPWPWGCKTWQNIKILSPSQLIQDTLPGFTLNFFQCLSMLVILHNSKMPSVLFFIPNGSAWNNNTL